VIQKLFYVLIIPILALLLSGCAKKAIVSSLPSAQSAVCDESKGCPVNTGESTVRTFLELISEKKIAQATEMMNSQGWSENFNSIKKLEIKKIEGNGNTFKVTLNLEVNKPGEYNWENGENIRWITVIKDENNIWKIDSIATGP
jgi:hypothetical protein